MMHGITTQEKFHGEYHFPVKVDEVREWLKGVWRKEKMTILVRDTNDFLLTKAGHWLVDIPDSDYYSLWLNGE